MQTVPTVGTSLVNVTIGREKKRVTVQEIGGEMVPLWSQYYADCAGIIYLIDSSRPEHISANCVRLLEIASDENIRAKNVVIVLNKIDLEGPLTVDDLIETTLIPDIIASFPSDHLQLVRTSSLTGNGIYEVLKWIESLTRKTQ